MVNIAGEIEGFDINSIVTSTLGYGYDVVIGIILLLVAAGIAGAIVYFSMYTRKVRIRHQTKDGSYIIDDKAKKKIVDGIECWQLQKLRVNVTPPPKGAINLTKKGKFTAECYMTEGSKEPIWIEDKGPREGFADVMLTSQERALLVHRIRKAESRRKKGLLDTITQLATPIALVMVVVVMLVFWESIAEPAKEMSAANSALMEKNAEIAAQNARITSVLAGKLEVGELNIIQTAPPDAEFREETG